MKKRMGYRGLALVLAAILLCVALPLGVAADTPLSAEVNGNTYQYTVTGGKATIVGAEAKGDVVIPETLGGYPVVALGEEAFYRLWDITAVTVPGCVKTIGDRCFAACIHMERAVLGEGVETIGDEAFRASDSEWVTASCGCCSDIVEYDAELQAVTLPASVRHIGREAFADIPLSGEFSLPASLTYLGEDAFWDTGIETLHIPAGMGYTKDMTFSRMKKLTAFVVDAGNTAYRVENDLLLADGGTVALYFIDKGQTTATVPASVKVIERTCFTATGIRQVTLPTSLRDIKELAFQNCENLAAITIPEGTETIGERAFYECGALAALQLPTTLTAIGQHAFSRCEALTKVDFPCQTLTIGAWAFSHCTKLAEVTFTGRELSIGESAFYKCKNIKVLELSPEKIHLGANLFAETGIETLIVRSNNITTDPNLYKERQLYYPSYNDNNLQKLVIGKNVTKLNEALYLPASLWQVELEAGNTAFLLEDAVLYNRDKTELIRVFSSDKDYTTREKFTVPSTVRKIGNKAFMGATVSLVVLPEGLEAIGDKAFYESVLSGSEERYHVILPASVKTIGKGAFGETSIGYFNIMGDNLTALRADMFTGCVGRCDVYYTGDKASLDKILTAPKDSVLGRARFHYNTTSATHQYVETVGKKATAKAKGHYLYTCPCGQTYTRPIYKAGSIDIGYHTVENEFYHYVYTSEPHVLPEGLEWGVDYTYTVSAKKDGYLTFTITFMGDRYEGTVTKEEAVYMDPVKSLAVSRRATDGVSLTWKSVESADGYKIARYDAAKKSWETIGSTTDLFYNDNGLTAGTTYRYKVTAFVDVDGICELIGDNWVEISAKTAKDAADEEGELRKSQFLTQGFHHHFEPRLIGGVIFFAHIAFTLMPQNTC
ncbi:MAG: leucine-rich repeat protein, partial [Clostridia bacterium]|nr:leucine-rich repeat protein [Clostridia bacterium]